MSLRFHVEADEQRFTDVAGTVPASANNDPIRCWKDLSGGGWHITEATNPPLVLADSGFKSEPAVIFNGTTQLLNNATFNLSSELATGTWVVCCDIAEGDTALGGWFVSPHNNRMGVLYSGGAIQAWNHGGAFELATTNHPNLYGKLIIARWDTTQSSNATKMRMRINRIDRTLTFSGAPINGAYAVGAGLWVGRGWDGSAFLKGRIFALRFYDHVLTTAEIEELEALYAAKLFTRGAKRVFCVGDSLTQGYPDNNANDLDWPKKLSNLLGPSWVVSDNNTLGFPAFTIAQIEQQARGYLSLNYDDWADRNVVIHQGGTNNIWPTSNNQEAATALAEMAATVAVSQATGGGRFEIFVCTIPPIGDTQGALTDPQEATYEARRVAYNASVLAGDAGVDIAHVIRWDTGPLDVVAPPYYDEDMVHFEAAGNDILAQLAYASFSESQRSSVGALYHFFFGLA